MAGSAPQAEAIQHLSAATIWIASSLSLFAMTVESIPSLAVDDILQRGAGLETRDLPRDIL